MLYVPHCKCYRILDMQFFRVFFTIATEYICRSQTEPVVHWLRLKKTIFEPGQYYTYL